MINSIRFLTRGFKVFQLLAQRIPTSVTLRARGEQAYAITPKANKMTIKAKTMNTRGDPSQNGGRIKADVPGVTHPKMP